MRIVIDARLYGLKHRGIGRYVMELVNGLAAIDKSNKYILLIDPSAQANFVTLPHNFSCQAAPWRIYSLAEQIYLPKLIKQLKPDLIHWPHFSAPFFSPQPYVITIHDLILHHTPNERASQLPGLIYWLKIIAYRILLRRLVKNARRVITVSQSVADDIRRFYGVATPISVTHLGIARLTQSQTPKIQTPYLLMVGAAYPHKNLERTIQAVARVTQIKPNLKLYIVGRDDFFMLRLRKWVSQMGLNNLVVFCGEVSEAELAGYYQAAQAYLLTSLYEGFGLGALEALRCGTVVVAADIPVLHEVLGPAAVYTKPDSLEAIAEAIIKIFEPEQRQKLLLAAQKVLPRYSWSKTVAATQAIYRMN
jgi:glycosyltransferase involved in cell wall biosynthesis